MCRHAKFPQNRPDHFSDIVIHRFSRWPQTIISDFRFLDFCLPVRLGGLIGIEIPNFIKIGQMAAKIWNLTLFSK